MEIQNIGEGQIDKRKKSKARVSCFLIRCPNPNCKFEQQTLNFKSVICNNADCKKEIDVQANLIKIVNGGEGMLKFADNKDDN